MKSAPLQPPVRDALALPRRPAPSARRLAWGLAVAALVLILIGLCAGAEGWSLAWREDAGLILAIRAPRTLGALLAGALLGLAGALAQGLFRNPLADPYLLGSAAGAGLGVVLVLAAGGLLGASMGLAAAGARAAAAGFAPSGVLVASSGWV